MGVGYYLEMPQILKSLIKKFELNAVKIVMEADDPSVLKCCGSQLKNEGIDQIYFPQISFGYHPLASLSSCFYVFSPNASSQRCDMIWVHSCSKGEVEFVVFKKE